MSHNARIGMRFSNRNRIAVDQAVPTFIRIKLFI
jgi:hypothetical protein